MLDCQSVSIGRQSSRRATSPGEIDRSASERNLRWLHDEPSLVISSTTLEAQLDAAFFIPVVAQIEPTWKTSRQSGAEMRLPPHHVTTACGSGRSNYPKATPVKISAP